jgi:hypothetical protein
MGSQEAFLASRYFGELELALEALGGVSQVAGLRDVASAEGLGTYVVGEAGLYEVIDGARVLLKVAGHIDALEVFGARSLIFLKDGEAYLFEGGEPRLALGGVVERGQAQVMARRGDEVWIATDVALWRLVRDAQRGDLLERYAPLGEVERLWASAKSSQLGYRLVDGSFGLLDLSQSPPQRVVIEAAGEALGGLYPSRDGRVLATLGGQLVEWAEQRWWWRTIDEARAEQVQGVGAVEALDSGSGAMWMLDPSGAKLWRVESSWSASAALPEALVEADVAWIKPMRGADLWVMSGAGAIYSLSVVKMERPTLLDPPDGPITFKAHIEPIGQAACQGCHVTGQGGALVRLASYEDWKSPRLPLLGSIRSGRMPKEAPPMPEFADLLEQWERDGFLEE